MKSLYFLAAVTVIASVAFASVLFTHPAVYVIGGDYVLPEGETLNADLLMVFAQVSVEQGARINGQVISLCSELDLKGTLEEKLVDWDFFGYKILLPRLRRLQIGA